MLPFRKHASSPSTRDPSTPLDMRTAVLHCLDVIAQLSQLVDVPVEDKVRLRRLKMATSQARGEIELEAVAMDIHSLRMNTPAALPDPVDANAIVARAAHSAEAVSDATEVPGLSLELRRLAAHPPPDPIPPALEEFDNEMNRVAGAVRFLRKRGDVLAHTANGMADMLGVLAEEHPEVLGRLRRTKVAIEQADHIEDLETLRERLLCDTKVLVDEAETRCRSSAAMRDLVDLHQSHKKLLESALADANAMANGDALTGMGNRRALDRAVQGAARDSGDIGVILFELDGLADLNDRLSRDGADDIVRQLSTLLNGDISDTEQVFRLEGGAFVVLAPESTLAEADQKAKAFVERVANHPFRSRGEDVHCTLSVGVSLWNAGKAFRQVFTVADKCRASVKSKGGNGVRSKST